MATEKQKEAARRNLNKARAAQKSSSGPKGTKAGSSHRLSTAEQNDMPDRQFAFPEQRKEPLIDAAHVRNAIARFDQVEGSATRIVPRRGAASRRQRRSTASRSRPGAGGN